MSTLAYDHPLPPGTVLKAQQSDVRKVIVGVNRMRSSGEYEYEAVNIGSGDGLVHVQTSEDLEVMANNKSYPNWELFVRGSETK